MITKYRYFTFFDIAISSPPLSTVTLEINVTVALTKDTTVYLSLQAHFSKDQLDDSARNCRQLALHEPN